MQSSSFAVNDVPFCLWEIDPVARTRAFLDGTDPDYFDYILQAHLNTEDEKRASVAIRLWTWPEENAASAFINASIM